MNILVVEDDKVSRKILQQILSRYGKCDLATTGEEAISAYASSFRDGAPYQLICLDLIIPEVNGLKVLERMRALDREHPGQPPPHVIVVTSIDERENIVEAYHQGCEAYLVKPINRAKLEARLSSFGFTAPRNADT